MTAKLVKAVSCFSPLIFSSSFLHWNTLKRSFWSTLIHFGFQCVESKLVFVFLKTQKKGNFGLKIHFLGHLIFFLKSLFYRWVHLHVLFRFFFLRWFCLHFMNERQTSAAADEFFFFFFLKPWPLGFLTQKSHKLSRNNYLVFSFSMKRFIQTEKWMMMTHWGKNPFSVQ